MIIPQGTEQCNGSRALGEEKREGAQMWRERQVVGGESLS